MVSWIFFLTLRPEYESLSIKYVKNGAMRAWILPPMPMLLKVWMRGSYQYSCAYWFAASISLLGAEEVSGSLAGEGTRAPAGVSTGTSAMPLGRRMTRMTLLLAGPSTPTFKDTTLLRQSSRNVATVEAWNMARAIT